MSKKRNASNDLNHDNWNQPEQKEEAGVFTKASNEVLQNRVIKTAKRKSTGLVESSETKSPFSSFTGFKSISSTTSSPFAFLNQPSSNNVSSTIKDNKTSYDSSNDVTNTTTTQTNTSLDGEKKNEDLQLLKDLNVCCSNWIGEHVQKNPYCILTPIFKDYEQHLSKLKLEIKNCADVEDVKTVQQSSNTVTKTTDSIDKKTEVKFPSIPSQGSVTTDMKTNLDIKPSPFGSVLSGSSEFKPGGSWPTPTFSFGSNVIQKPNDEQSNVNNPDEDEPPKNEFTPVVEDCIYSIKCKVFVKKDNEFVTKGLGMLYLKQIENPKRVQLLVRADTNLGNILLNVWLTDSLPIQTSGKNNIMLICLPTPESKPPPSTILIKVKNGEDRDRTLEKMKSCIQSS